MYGPETDVSTWVADAFLGKKPIEPLYYLFFASSCNQNKIHGYLSPVRVGRGDGRTYGRTNGPTKRGIGYKTSKKCLQMVKVGSPSHEAKGLLSICSPF